MDYVQGIYAHRRKPNWCTPNSNAAVRFNGSYIMKSNNVTLQRISFASLMETTRTNGYACIIDSWHIEYGRDSSHAWMQEFLLCMLFWRNVSNLPHPNPSGLFKHGCVRIFCILIVKISGSLRPKWMTGAYHYMLICHKPTCIIIEATGYSKLTS